MIGQIAKCVIYQATLVSAGICSETDTCMVNEAYPAQVKKGERAIQGILAAFQNFNNPFHVSNQEKLYCISSGRPATDDIGHDLLTTDEKGVAAHSNIIETRLVNKTIKFNHPIKRMKLKTFASLTVTKSISNL